MVSGGIDLSWVLGRRKIGEQSSEQSSAGIIELRRLDDEIKIHREKELYVYTGVYDLIKRNCKNDILKS